MACSSRLDSVSSYIQCSRPPSRESSENLISSHEASDEDAESVGLLQPEFIEVDFSSGEEDQHGQDQEDQHEQNQDEPEQDQDQPEQQQDEHGQGQGHAEDEQRQVPEPGQEEDNQPLEGENEPPGDGQDENPNPPAQNNQDVPLHNPNVVPGHQKLHRKMGGDYGPIIDTQVNVSRNDALYMALGLAKRENFSNSTLSNSVKLTKGTVL